MFRVTQTSSRLNSIAKMVDSLFSKQPTKQLAYANSPAVIVDDIDLSAMQRRRRSRRNRVVVDGTSVKTSWF